MNYLLSEKGRRELEALSKGRCLYAFDFDGTLAKIVSDPGGARLGRSVQVWLEALAKRAQTAVISGRSLEDLRPRVGAGVCCLVGNHGSEGPHVVQEEMFQVQETCNGWLQLITDQFQADLTQCGVFVEKKSYSLSFHYRTVQQRSEARALISRIVAELAPTPRIVLGKSVVNVIPTTAWHKGTALQKCMRHLGCTTALYVGDDVTDEDVFALRDPRVLTVRIGKKNASSARFFLNRQTEIAKVLRLIVEMAG
jgi:trehalose 6-phosphate phosphatase